MGATNGTLKTSIGVVVYDDDDRDLIEEAQTTYYRVQLCIATNIESYRNAIKRQVFFS